MSTDQNEQNNTTEIRYASIAHSGSGNVFYQGSFAPVPTIAVNGSNLPNPHPHFVGREDKIQEVIHALSSRAWIIGIDGLGGIGKTTLALEVAHLCKKRSADYPDLPHFTSYIWISARNKPNFGLRDAIREILYVLSAFEINKRKLSDIDQLSLALRALSVEPRLIIIDNFESIPEDESLYQFLREFPSPSKVLITSRLRINTGEEVVTLGGLAEKDAVKLLQLEAHRLGVPVDERDMTRLRVVARKSFGIPFVLRWVMERVREGQTLEWAVKSLENATAEDIFGYIFKSSLALLDTPTREIFHSMSLLSTWTSIETIQAMNPRIAAVADRVGDLVKYSLVEDNLRLTPSARRFQLHPFTRYLARRELSGMDDGGAGVARNVLEHYLAILQSFPHDDPGASEYLAQEFGNVRNIVQFATQLSAADLVDQCILIFKAIQKLDPEKGKVLLHYLTELNDSELVLKLFSYVPNPYSTGTPVKDQSMFFGREELFSSIQDIFEKNDFAAITLLGSRRVGKTSFLLQLAARQEYNFVYVLIDMQALSYRMNLSNMLFRIASQINTSIKRKIGVLEGDESLQTISYKDFSSQPLQVFDAYLESIRKHTGNLRLVLIFDEFDVLLDKILKGQDYLLDFLGYLRAKVSQGAFGIIITNIYSPVDVTYKQLGSPFFNIFQLMHISGLSRKSASEMIRKPVRGLLTYREDAIEYVLNLSGCYPYFIHVLCRAIVDVCNERRELVVDCEIVETVLNDVYRNLLFHFDWMIGSLSEFEKAVLFATALTIEVHNKPISVSDIAKVFNQSQIAEIDEALHVLERNDIIIADKQRRYSFTVELFRRWLLKQNSGNERETMNTDKQKQDKPTITNTTHIGSVAGPVHTGSGDIKIDSISYTGTISTKEDFLAALRTFREELEAAGLHGLPEETYDDTIIEVEAAEREAKKDTAKPDRIISRLGKAKAILMASAGMATAATSLVEAYSKLSSLIEAAIQAASRLF